MCSMVLTYADGEGVTLTLQDGLKAEPPPLTEAESGLRNEKIAIDDFQDKVANASRKVDNSHMLLVSDQCNVR